MIEHVSSSRLVGTAGPSARTEPDNGFEEAFDELFPRAVRLVLSAGLLNLAPRQRQAVALRYLGGLSDREVAQALGISLGSVKTHIHRGLNALRARLGASLEEVVPIALD